MTPLEPDPQAHLYTRLRVSPGRGIGVFAIRDIPKGMNPFGGDNGMTVMVPRATVEGIEDQDLRRMYVDFCPLIDGSYLAPADFNRMTIAWYLNHSEQPTMVADHNVSFVATRLICRGEELTIDYRDYSEHAEHFIALWPVTGG